MGVPIKKRNPKSKKGLIGKRIDVIFKAIKWLLFLVLCMIAVMFMIDVMNQFQARETVIGHSLKPITNLPTITLCAESAFEYLKDLEMSIGIENVEDESLYHPLIENQPFVHGNISIFLNQVSLYCFKLNASMTSALPKGMVIGMKITFFERSSEVTAHFTSEINSYGVYNKEWFDGKVYKEKLEVDQWKDLSITSTQHKFLEEESECSHESNLGRWLKYIPKANFTDCPLKCSRYTYLASDNLPVCAFVDTDEICNELALLDNYDEFKESIGFINPCNILEYDGSVIMEYGFHSDPKEAMFTFRFAKPEKTVEYKERLVFDELGLIAYVGGTLGMCIGFSFIGTISSGLEIIKNRIKSML